MMMDKYTRDFKAEVEVDEVVGTVIRTCIATTRMAYKAKGENYTKVSTQLDATE